MTDSLTLTFAELEFILALRPQRSAALRGNLRLEGDGSTPSLVRAGLASLLARGLCETVDGGAGDGGEGGVRDALPDLRFGPEASALLRALADDDCVTSMAAVWCGERGGVVHVVDGGGARTALYPARFGLFGIEALDAAQPLSAALDRLLSRNFADGERSALVATSAGGERSVAIAIAVDDAGQWSVSDSLDTPDHAVPVSRERALERLAELFDGVAASAASEQPAGLVGSNAPGAQGDPR